MTTLEQVLGLKRKSRGVFFPSFVENGQFWWFLKILEEIKKSKTCGESKMAAILMYPFHSFYTWEVMEGKPLPAHSDPIRQKRFDLGRVLR